MKVKYIICFTGTPEEDAENQMFLSAALAETIGSLNDISSTFVDGLPFEVFWEKEFIKILIGNSILQLTQSEALHQAANLRLAALAAGATLDCGH